MAESELFETGLQARRDVLGAEYVDANLADADEFMTIAKFRAVRKLWPRIEDACGLSPRPVLRWRSARKSSA